MDDLWRCLGRSTEHAKRFQQTAKAATKTLLHAIAFERMVMLVIFKGMAWEGTCDAGASGDLLARSNSVVDFSPKIHMDPSHDAEIPLRDIWTVTPEATKKRLHGNAIWRPPV